MSRFVDQCLRRIAIFLLISFGYVNIHRCTLHKHTISGTGVKNGEGSGGTRWRGLREDEAKGGEGV